MNNLSKHIGIVLVLMGVAALVVAYLAGFTSKNWVLFLSLAAIVAGVFFHIVIIKKSSKY